MSFSSFVVSFFGGGLVVEFEFGFLFVLGVLLLLTFLKAPQFVSLWLAVKACW